MNRKQFILTSLAAGLAIAFPVEPKTFSGDLDNIEVKQEGGLINLKFYTCNAQGYNEALVKDIWASIPSRQVFGRNKKSRGYGKEYKAYELTLTGKRRDIEWFDFSMNIPRTNVNVFGPLEKVSHIIIQPPKVSLEIRYA